MLESPYLRDALLCVFKPLGAFILLREQPIMELNKIETYISYLYLFRGTNRFALASEHCMFSY